MATCDPNEVIQACWACRSPQELQAAMVGLLCDISSGGGGGSGTVTSVGLTVPAFLSVSGSPVTTAGTLAVTLSGTALPAANGGTGLTALGTGIATFLGGGALDLQGNAISDFIGVVNRQTGTTYTLAAGDTGKIVEVSNGSSITVTLPNSFPVGYNVVVTQMGAGQISFSAAAGGTLRNRSSQTKIAGQYGVTSLYVSTNAGGTAAEWVLSGDTGT